MHSRRRRYGSTPHLSDNFDKQVDTHERYRDLVTSSRLLDERVDRRFKDRHYHGDGPDRVRIIRSSRSVPDDHIMNKFISNSETLLTSGDSFIPYGARSRPPEMGKWLAYAKNIKPRKQRESNLNKTRSMDNIDISSKYPRLHNSDFYLNLHKKYPQAFQRRLEAKTRRPSRRLFNSGLHVHFQEEAYDSEDTRSVCSERPVSNLERDLSEFLVHNNDRHFDRDCRTSPTPSLVSDMTVKERLDATSDRLYHLLYNGLPQPRGDPAITPRSEVTPRSHRSRTSSGSSDVHRFNDFDRLSSPRHLDPYSSLLDSTSLTQEEQIQTLQRELAHRDKQLTSYRQKLEKSANVSKHHEDLDSSYTRVLSPESPPDSAIDVDSSSVQSVISMDTRCLPNNENIASLTDVKHSNESDRLQLNGFLPNVDGNYFVNDMESFVLNDVIQEVDEEELINIVENSQSSEAGVAPKDCVDGSCVKDSGVEGVGLEGGGVAGVGLEGGDVAGSGMTEDSERALDSSRFSSSPETEAEALMKEIVVQAMSRLPSSDLHGPNNLQASHQRQTDNNLPNSSANKSHSSNLSESPSNSNHKSPSDDLHISPSDDLHISPSNDLHISPSNDLHEPSSNNLHYSPNTDLRNSQGSDPESPRNCHVHFDEDVDDSDPRLGLPQEKEYDENLIQKRYHDKLLRFQCRTKRRCVTPRDRPVSAPVCRDQLHSDNQALCSPRSASGLDVNNDLERSRVHRSNYSLNVVPEKQDFVTRRMVSESDIRNVGLENSGIFFSKSSHAGSIGSFQSDFSADTLVASHQTLTEDPMVTYPKVTLPSPRKKFRFKNIFKGKKGHYNPSHVEASLPVDVSYSVPDLSHQSNQNLYSVQYKSQHHDQHYSETPASNNEPCSPPLVDDHLGANTPTNQTAPSWTNSNDPNIAAGHRQASVLVRDDDSNSNGAPLHDSTHHSHMTAYEAAVVNLDQHGVNVDELIDSDSDNMFSAKPVVIDSRKKQRREIKDKKNGMGSNDGESTESKNGIPTDIRHSNADLVAGEVREDNCVDTQSDNEVSGKLVAQTRPKQAHQTDIGQANLEAEKVESVMSIDSDREQSRESCTGGGTRGDKQRDSTTDTGGVVSTVGSGDTPGDGPYATVQASQQTPATTDSTDSHIYAEVDHVHKGPDNGTVSTDKEDIRTKQFSFVGSGVHVDSSITSLDDNTPPVPKRGYQMEESNLVRSKELSASKQSLTDKVRTSAKSKFKALRKAVSLDRGLNKAGADNSDETAKEKTKEKKKSGFKMPKIKNAPPLKNLFSKKKKTKPPKGTAIAKDEESMKTSPGQQTSQGEKRPVVGTRVSCYSIESVDAVEDVGLVEQTYPVGKLQKLNSDGTQTIEINKPQHGPMGFFIARGNAQFNHGVFVSRFVEGRQEALYSGLLNVGDEILEINKFVLKELALDDIYDIMAARDALVMRVLPLMARQDV